MISKWKQTSTNNVVPTNSRPFHNKDPNLESLPRTPFKANPIKHWRKQLQPYYKTHSKQVSINMIDAPSSSVHVKSRTSDCLNNSQLLKENIDLLRTCYGTKHIDEESGEVKCSGGTNHITRSANTNIKKNYYTNHAQYLKSRCKTHEQNQIIGKKVSGNKYKPAQCYSSVNGCNKEIIFKPNNTAFTMQGAASASANTKRKQNKALTKNSASLMTTYGNAPVMVKGYYAGETGYEISYLKGNVNDNKDCQSTFKVCK